MFHVIGDKQSERISLIDDVQLDEAEGDPDLCVLFSHDNISTVRDFLDNLENSPPGPPEIEPVEINEDERRAWIDNNPALRGYL